MTEEKQKAPDSEEWLRAYLHLQDMLRLYEDLPPISGSFGVAMLREWQQRFIDGDRSEELLKQMQGIE